MNVAGTIGSVVLLGLSGSAAILGGCRSRGATGNDDPPPSGGEAALVTDASLETGTGQRSADRATARADEARRDAGAVDPACTGADLSLLAVVLDERCAIKEGEWNRIRDADGGGDGTGQETLVQRARREGATVVFSLVNGGPRPAVVPLRFQPARPDLPAWSVFAEDERHAVFELAAPAPEPIIAGRSGDAGSPKHVHSARIVLPPGGAASAKIVIDPRITRRLDRSCDDASACAPPRLPKGHYTLYVGQLLTAVEAGPPASVGWDQP